MRTAPPASFIIPAGVAGVLGRLPAYPGSWLFARALNLALARHLPADVRAALEGRALRLAVQDAKLVFDFTWRGAGFAAGTAGAQPELTIRASAQDLWRMARREEDPDTLFFSRRLVLEGDTELGLLFKNTLDSLDLSVFDLAAGLGSRRRRRR
ncbi:SCP2 domain-containing protein [Pseudoduganella sp. GCM10020061]|uniref:ubiquinone anaerobic biosynthesis accessory factor UbiT n=1 Tax=Pseudoduganella sp. GCM10020061 TaxID=3317345 RepID=UPI003639E72C